MGDTAGTQRQMLGVGLEQIDGHPRPLGPGHGMAEHARREVEGNRTSAAGGQPPRAHRRPATDLEDP